MFTKKNLFELLTIANLISFVVAGCGGGMATVTAAKRAKGEQPSIEVCLDRVGDIGILQQQLDDFVYRSPMSEGTPWVDKIVVVPPDRAAAIIQQLQSQAPYNLPGTQVPPSKVFAIYNEEVLADSTAFIGNHLNFLSALEGLGVPEASKIKNKYEGVKANWTDMAAVEGEIEGLKTEAKLDSTPSHRKSAIAGQVERLEANLESLKSRNEAAESALFSEIDALKAQGMLGPEFQPLAQNLFYVAQHLARMEEESLVTLQLVGIQLVRAMPDLPAELQSMAGRLIGDVMAELGQQAASAQNASISVQLQDGMLSVKVSGLQTVDPMVVQQKLTARLTEIKDKVFAAPTTAATAASVARFELKFFTKLANALGTASGNTFSSALSFAVPGVSASVGPAGGGFGLPGGGYGQPQPAPGAGGYGQPQPAPGAGGYGQPQPALPAPVPEPTPAPAPVPVPEPAPPAPEPPPPAPPAPAATNQCPPSLCAGQITKEGVGQIKLGIQGIQAARLIGKRIAPKVDETHKMPTDNVDGILITFCDGVVCRLEVTVNPPVTQEGIGVGDKLQKVARSYGQSRCKPVDSTRFAVEFERQLGVFWISDRLDCEGIEDLDFWDRPCKGSVTSIIITK